MDTEAKAILIKDTVVILAAVGGLLGFYSVLYLVSTLAQIPLP